MHFAAAKEHVQVIDLLMKYGASLEVENKNGQKPLDLAVIEGHLSVVKQLVGSGANIGPNCIQQAKARAYFSKYEDRIKIRDYIIYVSKGWSPLHVAALHQDLEGGKLFVTYGFKM